MKAKASNYDDNPNALLGCQCEGCRFAGRPADFLDARIYPAGAEDAFGCPCCGHSNVCEITLSDPVPAVPVIDRNGRTLREVYK